MKLKEFLVKERYTISWLHEQTGIPVSNLSRFASGKLTPGKKCAKRIQDATWGKVSMYELIFPELDLELALKNKIENENKCTCECNRDKKMSNGGV